MEPDVQGRSSAGAFRGVALNAECVLTLVCVSSQFRLTGPDSFCRYLAVAFPTFIVFGDHADFPKFTYFTTSNRVAAAQNDFLMSVSRKRDIGVMLQWGDLAAVGLS